MAVWDVARQSARDRYGAPSWFQPVWRAIAAEVDLDEGCFLDMNADTGWVCIHVAAGKPELDAVGMNPCADARNIAERNRERRLNVTFKDMAPEIITYPADTFGCVLALGVAQRWDDVPAVLTEVYRVLSPGGRLLIYDPQPAAEIPHGWVSKRGPWPTESLVRRWLTKNAMDDAKWDALKGTVKASPFGGGQEGSHGFFRRMVLTRSA